MESVLVPKALPYVKMKHQRALNNPYNIDFWKEVKKRWMVAGVLAAVLLAVISPRVGAPGGPLRAEYLSYIAMWTIYWGAGARLGGRGGRPPPALLLAAALHAHVAAPALCVCAVAMFGDALHAPVISGALLSSVGGGCGWLTLALSRSAAAPLVAAGCGLGALLGAPLGALLLCGRTSLPPAGSLAPLLASAAAPLALGAAARRARGRALRGQRAADRAAALALLYADCCGRLAEAEGALHVTDLMATLFVEVLWVGLTAGACAVYARWWGARGARLIALCAVPKAFDAAAGWGAACAAPPLARLPGALAAPAQALLLTALHDHADDDDDDDDDWEEKY